MSGSEFDVHLGANLGPYEYDFLGVIERCLFNDATCEFGREGGVKIKHAYVIWKLGVRA